MRCMSTETQLEELIDEVEENDDLIKELVVLEAEIAADAMKQLQQEMLTAVRDKNAMSLRRVGREQVNGEGTYKYLVETKPDALVDVAVDVSRTLREEMNAQIPNGELSDEEVAEMKEQINTFVTENVQSATLYVWVGKQDLLARKFQLDMQIRETRKIQDAGATETITADIAASERLHSRGSDITIEQPQNTRSFQAIMQQMLGQFLGGGMGGQLPFGGTSGGTSTSEETNRETRPSMPENMPENMPSPEQMPSGPDTTY